MISGRWVWVLPTLLVGCRVVSMPAPTPALAALPAPSASPDPVTDRSIEARPVEVAETTLSVDEVRALWVVRFTMTSEQSVRDLVATAARNGINTLIVQVRGRADAFYASEIEPRGESVQEPAPFDPLALVIREAHANDIAVHAWVNTHLVWGPAALPESPEHIVNAHPDWLAVPRTLGREMAGVDPFDSRFVESLVQFARDNSSTVEGVYTSPSHPAVQDRVHAVWLDLVARYDLDGVHFDYIRFPSAQYDYSLGALERFRRWSRTRLPAGRWSDLAEAYGRDLYAFADGEPELWAAFRREHVSRLVRRIHRDVKAANPQITISAAVIADVEEAENERFQEWPTWLADGTIDVAVPMAYTSDSARFQALIRSARAAAGQPDRIWAGIGIYMNTLEGTLGMIDIARDEETGGFALFSYDWAVGDGRGEPEYPLLRRISEGRFGR